MIRVALLRGINVGGKRRVEMARLRSTFERAGAARVRTYINSGNVIFDDAPDGASGGSTTADLARTLEAVIAEDFGFEVPVLLRDLEELQAVRDAIPDGWVSDATMRADVWFLWPEVDEPAVLDRLPARDGVDEVRYVPGAVLWYCRAADLARSGRSRVVGTAVYRSVTLRNVNTVRKLAEMMEADAAEVASDA